MAKIHVLQNGCWQWTGTKTSNGYGRFDLKPGKHYRAHRYSYAMFRGPIPDGQCVLHRCDYKPCVRPDHLFLGTINDNNQDMVQKGRQVTKEKHPNAKLTMKRAREIRIRFKIGGISKRTLATIYGVADSQIHNILKGKTWREE